MRIPTILVLFISLILFLIVSTIEPYTDEPEISAFNDGWNGTSLLFNHLAGEGCTTKILFSGVMNLEGMEKSTILVINGKSSNYSLGEIRFIRDFVENGGRLILTDRDNRISSRFSVKFSEGNLVDFKHHGRRQDLPIVPYQISNSGGILVLKFPSAITDYPPDAKLLSMSSENSWVDVDRNKIINVSADLRGPFPVAIYMEYGKGSAVFVSDSKIATNDMIKRGDNLQFLTKAIELLRGGDNPVIVFDESHTGGDHTSPVDHALSSLEFPTLRNLAILLFVITSLFYSYLFFIKRRERRTQKVLTEPNVGEFRKLVGDIKKKFKTRFEPYNWIIIMRYKELRRILLRHIPPSKREFITNKDLVSLVYLKKKNFDQDELLHLLRACENIKNGKNMVKTLKEAKFLEGRIKKYIGLIKR